MHTVPQNKDKFTISNLFYYCEALIFTHPLVYEFLCGLIFMGHPVNKRLFGLESLNRKNKRTCQNKHTGWKIRIRK